MWLFVGLSDNLLFMPPYSFVYNDLSPFFQVESSPQYFVFHFISPVFWYSPKISSIYGPFLLS